MGYEAAGCSAVVGLLCNCMRANDIYFDFTSGSVSAVGEVSLTKSINFQSEVGQTW